MKDFKNPINPTDNQSLGVAIQKLIEDNTKRINTSFLAKIESINGGGLVDVVDIINQREGITNPVIPNAIYGVPSSGLFQISHNAKVGDIGLAIVLKNDINIYKSNKKGGEPATKRFFDVNDCIFIPLSLLNYPPDDNYSIKSSDSKVSFELTKDSINLQAESKVDVNSKKTIQLKSQGAGLSFDNKLSINNAGVELKDVIDGIIQILQDIPKITGQVVVPPTIATNLAQLEPKIKTFFG